MVRLRLQEDAVSGPSRVGTVALGVTASALRPRLRSPPESAQPANPAEAASYPRFS